MAAKGDFKVTVLKKEIVAALLPFQEHRMPLSNLDLLLPPLDVSVFFCYKKLPALGYSLSFSSLVGILKKALAQALASYYPFAAELVPNFMGEPELCCNNRGVDFIEAYADVELRNLDLHNPGESIEGRLVPEKKHGLLSVQVSCL